MPGDFKDTFNNILAFAPDSIRLAVSSGGPIQLWDIPSREIIGQFRGFGFLRSLAISSQGFWVAAGNGSGEVTLWDLPTRELAVKNKAHDSHLIGLAFSPHGKVLATGGEDHLIHLWDLSDTNGSTNSLEKIATLKGHCRLLLAPGTERQPAGLWDLKTDQEVATFPDSVAGWGTAAFSPDSRLLAYPNRSYEVMLWDAVRRNFVAKLEGHRRGIPTINFSPDGKLVVSGSLDQDVRIWDVAAGKEAFPALKGHRSGVFQTFFSPDGRSLATCSWDRSIRVWNVATGREMLLLKDAFPDEAGVFSPDGGAIFFWRSGERSHYLVQLPALAEIDGKERAVTGK